MERFEAAARDGFTAVEYLFPYAWPSREIVACLRANGLQQVLFNAPAGGTDGSSSTYAWDSGLRGLACLPGCEAEFRQGIELALDYCAALQCPRLHVMSGLMPAGFARARLHDVLLGNLRWACEVAARQAVNVLIEPINQRDMPGYFLHRHEQAHSVLDALNADNLQIQFDLYHCQVSEGDIATKLRLDLARRRIGHIQIASVPQRQEPDSGELNYAYLFGLIDQLGYTGWIGCEYRPRLGAQPGGTSRALGWRKLADPTNLSPIV